MSVEQHSEIRIVPRKLEEKDRAFKAIAKYGRRLLPRTLLQDFFLVEDPANQGSGVVVAFIIGSAGEKLFMPLGLITPEGKPISLLKPTPNDAEPAVQG